MIKIYESKQDIERLEQFIGDEYANKFLSIRKGLKSPQNDIYYWLKKDKQELIDFLDSYQSNTNKVKSNKVDSAELIYSDKDWKVYHITSYEASKYYGRNTKWCISGSKVWDNGLNGEKCFNDYIDDGIEFYFYINSSREKYALALYPNDEYEIFNAEDESISGIVSAPDVKGLPDIKYEDVKIMGNVLVKCNNEEIESYEIPYGITEIGDDAFDDCTSLKSITIPDSVMEIGNDAFYNCTSLKSINIPDSVRGIGSCAFYNCKSLKSITIPDSVTDMDMFVFEDCSNLTVYCNKDSYAEKYCIYYGVNYISK